MAWSQDLVQHILRIGRLGEPLGPRAGILKTLHCTVLMQLNHPDDAFCSSYNSLEEKKQPCLLYKTLLHQCRCLLELYSFIRKITVLLAWLSSTSIKGRSSLCTGAAKWLHWVFSSTFWTTCSVFKTSQLQHFMLLKDIHD